MAAESDVQSHQRLLYAAIDDIGEAVRGNDAKSYAALVLHGLIFAGITALVTRLGGIYSHASDFEQFVGVMTLGLTLVCFLFSSRFLISAIRPYYPDEMQQRLEGRYRHVFFPEQALLTDPHPHPHELIEERLDQMDEVAVRGELVAEVLKLRQILDHESRQTELGYKWLGWEIIVATIFFLVVGISAT